MGRKKKSSGGDVNLDSFLDIMTCLVGVLVLIIILTGIDAAQIKVLIPTPMAHSTDKKPTFIECRNNQLFHIPLDEINRQVTEKLAALAREAGGDNRKLLQLLDESALDFGAYNVDLVYALKGQYAIRPKPEVEGYALEDVFAETEKDWLGKILTSMDFQTEIVTFIVRDDSFKVFKKARALAWMQSLEASYELLDITDPIKFGLGGRASLAQ